MGETAKVQIKVTAPLEAEEEPNCIPLLYPPRMWEMQHVEMARNAVAKTSFGRTGRCKRWRPPRKKCCPEKRRAPDKEQQKLPRKVIQDITQRGQG